MTRNTAGTFGVPAHLPGVEFTWAEFVRACQISRMLHDDRLPPSITPQLHQRIRQRAAANRMQPPPAPAPCWYCQHPVLGGHAGERPASVREARPTYVAPELVPADDPAATLAEPTAPPRPVRRAARARRPTIPRQPGPRRGAA